MERKNLSYSFFLGCVIPNRLPQIEAATRLVAPKLGINLIDMNGASCCPAPGVIRSFDTETWLAIVARNISLAEEIGHDLLTLCNGCYATLAAGVHEIQNPDTREHVNKILSSIGRQVKGTIKAKHLAEVLYFDVGMERIEETIVRPIEARCATHAGCHLIRPSELRPWGGTAEDFRAFDELVELTGMKSVEYDLKDMCCGAGGGLRSAKLPVSLDMVREKLEAMSREGVDCILNICPFCHLQYDLGQVQANKEFSTDFHIPVLYYTQLLGLAQGFTPREMGLDKHFVDTKPFLEKVGLSL